MTKNRISIVGFVVSVHNLVKEKVRRYNWISYLLMQSKLPQIWQIKQQTFIYSLTVSEGWESRWLSWVVLPQGLPWSFSQAISWGWSHISGFRGKSSSPSSLILAVLSPALCGPLWRRLPGCSHDTLFPQSEWLKKEWEITSWKRTTGLCNLFLQVTHCYVCQTLFTRRE